MCATVDQIQDKLNPVIDVDELQNENGKLHRNNDESLNNQEDTIQLKVQFNQVLKPVYKPSWNGELSPKREDHCKDSDIYKCGR
ncbi:hypothetical protein K9N50_07985 [bacterium]|nr:hypothetical protein [bacterium]